MTYRRMIVIVLLIAVSINLVCCLDIITTIAGTGATAYNGGGGYATSTTFNAPRGVALDSSGRRT